MTDTLTNYVFYVRTADGNEDGVLMDSLASANQMHSELTSAIGENLGLVSFEGSDTLIRTVRVDQIISFGIRQIAFVPPSYDFPPDVKQIIN